MKLSTHQIDAIVRSIQKEEEFKIILENKKNESLALPIARKRAKEIMKEYNKLPKELKRIISNYVAIDEKKVCDFLLPEKKSIRVNRDKVRDRVLIASIDSETIEQLFINLKRNKQQ